MRDFVRGDIVQHMRRHQDEPPGIGQVAAGRARAPAAALVADADAPVTDTHLPRIARACCHQLGAGFGLQPFQQAARNMRQVARHMNDASLLHRRVISPRRDAGVADFIVAAAQRNALSRFQLHIAAVACNAAFDPAARALGEIQRPASRHALRHRHLHLLCHACSGAAPAAWPAHGGGTRRRAFCPPIMICDGSSGFGATMRSSRLKQAAIRRWRSRTRRCAARFPCGTASR